MPAVLGSIRRREKIIILLTGMGQMILRYGVARNHNGEQTLTMCRTHVTGAA